MTNKFCVVGSPINHSLSPLLHHAAYKHLGLDFSYEATEVLEGELEDFLERSNYQGVSVTMPLKTEAFDLSDQRSEMAELTKAANTLTKTSSGWACDNTDVVGIKDALGSIGVPDRTVLIGSGATTSSALAALAQMFPNTRVEIMARNKSALDASVAFGRLVGLDASARELSSEAIASAELVLSLVPKGAFLDIWDEISGLNQPPRGWLFDVAYNPWPSVPAIAWRTEKVVSGLEMLIWQAIEQVQIFSNSVGKELKFDRRELYSVMRSAVSAK